GRWWAAARAARRPGGRAPPPPARAPPRHSRARTRGQGIGASCQPVTTQSVSRYRQVTTSPLRTAGEMYLPISWGDGEGMSGIVGRLGQRHKSGVGRGKLSGPSRPRGSSAESLSRTLSSMSSRRSRLLSLTQHRHPFRLFPPGGTTLTVPLLWDSTLSCTPRTEFGREGFMERPPRSEYSRLDYSPGTATVTASGRRSLHFSVFVSAQSRVSGVLSG